MDSTFTASTHACVEFSDGKKSAVPLLCITSTSESDKSIRVGDNVEVKWTDGSFYTATITALGSVHGNTNRCDYCSCCRGAEANGCCAGHFKRR